MASTWTSDLLLSYSKAVSVGDIRLWAQHAYILASPNLPTAAATPVTPDFSTLAALANPVGPVTPAHPDVAEDTEVFDNDYEVYKAKFTVPENYQGKNGRRCTKCNHVATTSNFKRHYNANHSPAAAASKKAKTERPRNRPASPAPAALVIADTPPSQAQPSTPVQPTPPVATPFALTPSPVTSPAVTAVSQGMRALATEQPAYTLPIERVLTTGSFSATDSKRTLSANLKHFSFKGKDADVAQLPASIADWYNTRVLRNNATEEISNMVRILKTVFVMAEMEKPQADGDVSSYLDHMTRLLATPSLVTSMLLFMNNHFGHVQKTYSPLDKLVDYLSKDHTVDAGLRAQLHESYKILCAGSKRAKTVEASERDGRLNRKSMESDGNWLTAEGQRAAFEDGVLPRFAALAARVEAGEHVPGEALKDGTILAMLAINLDCFSFRGNDLAQLTLENMNEALDVNGGFLYLDEFKTKKTYDTAVFRLTDNVCDLLRQYRDVVRPALASKNTAAQSADEGKDAFFLNSRGQQYNTYTQDVKLLMREITGNEALNFTPTNQRKFETSAFAESDAPRDVLEAAALNRMHDPTTAKRYYVKASRTTAAAKVHDARAQFLPRTNPGAYSAAKAAAQRDVMPPSKRVRFDFTQEEADEIEQRMILQFTGGLDETEADDDDYEEDRGAYDDDDEEAPFQDVEDFEYDL